MPPTVLSKRTYVFSKKAPVFSERAQARLPNVIIDKPYPQGFYDPVENPNGLINLAVAENGLMSAEILEFVHANFRMVDAHLRYRPALLNGHTPFLNAAIIKYLNSSLNPKEPITEGHIALGPGVGPLITHTVNSLCNDGDGILVTAPFYVDYPRDIRYPNLGVHVVCHPPGDPLSPDVIPCIRTTIKDSAAAGIPVKFLLLCNPHNPLARCYPEETIIGYANLAEELNIHLVVDEIYAGETFETGVAKDRVLFTSVLSLDLPGVNRSRIHVWTGPTKAFGAAGVRLGVFISQHNKDMRDLVDSGIGYSSISSATDAFFTPILNDEEFTASFLKESTVRVQKTAHMMSEFCHYHAIGFEKVSACVFMLIDIESLLLAVAPPYIPIDQQMADAEKAMLDAGIIVESHDPIPTRCRIVYTQPIPILKEALYRFENAFKLPHHEWNADETYIISNFKWDHD